MRAVGVFSLDVQERPDGKVELTKKFVDGFTEMARGWPGELVAVMAPRTRTDTNLDQTLYDRAELPFRLVIEDARSPALADVVRGAGVVLIGVDYRHIATARLCRELGVPYVVVAEYNLKTRLQIAAVEEERFERRMRRMVWELGQEARQRRVVAEASGLQCNGTPTFDGWSSLSKDAILFFDTRVRATQLASDDDIARRSASAGGVLRLAYSGRLVPMKGVLHLIDVAAELRERGVRFELRIFGGGSLEPALRERVAEEKLGGLVTLEGVLPFDELMERVRASVDLFLCPHVQGDPSCTYLETLSCGVPIVGFDNDAWRGLYRRSEAGFLCPLGDTRAMADVVTRLSYEADRLRFAGLGAVRFARHHTFEATFAQRMEHLRRVAHVD